MVAVIRRRIKTVTDLSTCFMSVLILGQEFKGKEDSDYKFYEVTSSSPPFVVELKRILYLRTLR